MVDKYYSEIHGYNKISEKNEEKINNIPIKENISKTSPSEEYLQTGKNDDVLQQNQEDYVKNDIPDKDLSNKLFFNEKKE